jgi:hypothetical protein
VRVAVRSLQVLLPTTAVLAAALLLAPGRAELAIHVYVLVLLAAALTEVVTAISALHRGADPSGFDAALNRRDRQLERLPDIARLERAVALAHASTFDVHYRLRPAVREIADGLLAVRHGIDLDRQPDKARALLGEAAWELARPERPPPADRSATGISTAELRRVVESLETL